MNIRRKSYRGIAENCTLISDGCNHIHHKFLAMGFSHRTTLAAIFSIAVCFVLLNILLSQSLNSAIILLIDAISWVGLHLYFNTVLSKREKRGKREKTGCTRFKKR